MPVRSCIRIDGRSMLTLDGGMGEGGGQILRSALSLSLCQQCPFHITNIRTRRSRPGLQRQHLAAVQAAATVGGAQVEGAYPGGSELFFMPRGLHGGEYRFDIGSAGSTTLVLQTILIPLLLADTPSRVTLAGGTHNPMAPTYDFIVRAFLPLLKRMGAQMKTHLLRPGFYPSGGGEFVVNTSPVSLLKPLQLERRGRVAGIEAEVLLARLPEHIALRELGVLMEGLGLTPDETRIIRRDDAFCPGNAVQVTLRSEACTELFSGIGQAGISAERVAEGVLSDVRSYLEAEVPVGPHLADQLLLPLALAGSGSFMTQTPDRHTLTNIEVVRRFLDIPISTTNLGEGRWRVVVGARS